MAFEEEYFRKTYFQDNYAMDAVNKGAKFFAKYR